MNSSKFIKNHRWNGNVAKHPTSTAFCRLVVVTYYSLVSYFKIISLKRVSQ